MDDAIPRPGDPQPEVYPEAHRTDFHTVNIHSPKKIGVPHRYRPEEVAEPTGTAGLGPGTGELEYGRLGV